MIMSPAFLLPGQNFNLLYRLVAPSVTFKKHAVISKF